MRADTLPFGLPDSAAMAGAAGKSAKLAGASPSAEVTGPEIVVTAPRRVAEIDSAWDWYRTMIHDEYVAYLQSFVVPTGFAVLYPHPALVTPDEFSPTSLQVLITGAALLFVTLAALFSLRRLPAVTVGCSDEP